MSVTLLDSKCLEVALPRYDLHFFLNHDGDFQCRELCKIVDSDQSVGTLIGLQSRLVLSGVEKLAKKHDRILLVPEGEATSSRNGSHVEVSISAQGPRVRLFQYPIDATLRRLQGDGDTYGTIYKAFLHAITTHTLPDPFTERTGTEEALVYLRQRSLGFDKPPDEKTVSLLTRISMLTPHRQYYPDHLKVMQQVKWDQTLSMMAQHDQFLPLAERIITSGNSYVVFYPESQPIESMYSCRDLHLLERAKIRNSSFWSFEFGGDINTRDHDSEHIARDYHIGATRGQKSFEIASLVKEWPQKLKVSKSLYQYLSMLGTVSDFGTQYDSSRPLIDLLNVKFSSSWAPLQQLCREVSPTLDRYRLLFLFAIIAYGREITSLKPLRTLLSFAFIFKLRSLPVPSDHSYIELSQGERLQEDVLRRTIMRNMTEYTGPGRKKHKAQWNIENRKHEVKSEQEAKAMLQYYKAQWPTDSPSNPSSGLSTNLKWGSTIEISALFYVWTSNEIFAQYLSQVQPVLDETYENASPIGYTMKEPNLPEEQRIMRPHGTLPSLAGLMSSVSPSTFSKPEILKIERASTSMQKNKRLGKLIATIRSDGGGRNSHSIRTQYREDLLASYEAFSRYKEQIPSESLPCALTDTLMHRATCQSDIFQALKIIHECLAPKSPDSTLLELSGLWPRLTIRSLLALISSRLMAIVPPPWRHCLLALGESVTTLQRARRLVLAAERNDISTFCVEIENEGHQNWDTKQWPDWLLIEIEGDLLIRPVQARVAFEMIQPSSSRNSLVQLNMGQ